jgi:hypothetical protein
MDTTNTAVQLGAALIRAEWQARLEDDLANHVQFETIDVVAYRLRTIARLEARAKDEDSDLLGRVFAELADDIEEAASL